MKVYHGTDSQSAQNILENGIKLHLGAKHTDNAQGFYMTASKEFARQRANMVAERARRKYNNFQIKPAVIELEIDMEAATELHVKVFEQANDEWGEFVLQNRLGQNELIKRQISNSNNTLDMKYDIVIDETADSGVWQLLERLRTSYQSGYNAFKKIASQISVAKNPAWSKQISFHSENAIKLIKSMKIIDSEE